MVSRVFDKSLLNLLVILAAAGGCGPALQQRVAPYPGYGQGFPQVQHDTAECDSWARSMAGSPGDATMGGAAVGALDGAATGAALGAIAGAIFGDAGSGAAFGAALGATSGGLGGAAGGAEAYDFRLVNAYRNCMAARGYVVDGTTVQPVATAPTASASPSAVSAESRPGIENRLIRLRDLHEDGLITDREYRDRRRAILEDL